MIIFDSLRYSYTGEGPVIPGLNGTWETGKIHGLIGPSGCGKTTLLYLIAGLLQPGNGSVRVNSETPVPGRRDTAVILQNHGLFPWKTTWENVALGLKIRKRKSPEIDHQVREILEELSLEGKEHCYPKDLSGGEQQRLAIGRALVLDPDLLLLDEPFSALDAMTREQLQDRLWELIHTRREEKDLTLVHVTHSIEEAVYLSDHIHIMNQRGEIISLSNTAPGPGYRLEKQYFEQCVALRKAFDEYAGATGGPES